MIYPSIDELSKNKYNRYQLCIATAKCARKIIDGDEDNIVALLSDFSDEKTAKKMGAEEKPVKMAINRLSNNLYRILLPGEEDKHK